MYHRPHRWSEGEGHFAIEIKGTPEGVVGKATHADPRKARRPLVAILRYLTLVQDEILAAFPAGKLPPVDKVTPARPGGAGALPEGALEPRLEVGLRAARGGSALVGCRTESSAGTHPPEGGTGAAHVALRRTDAVRLASHIARRSATRPVCGFDEGVFPEKERTMKRVGLIGLGDMGMGLARTSSNMGMS